MQIDINNELAADIERWVEAGRFRSVGMFLELAAAEKLSDIEMESAPSPDRVASPWLEERIHRALASGPALPMEDDWVETTLERAKQRAAKRSSTDQRASA